MKGIALVTGINCAGKGCVIEILSDLWGQSTRQPLVRVHLSERMKATAGLSKYRELEALDKNLRDEIRAQVFRQLAEEAKHGPLIVDTHCCFENGEITDFSPLRESVCQIVAVTAPPEVVLARLKEDKSDHPGREMMRQRGIDFISKYLDDERRHVETLIQEIQRNEGRLVRCIWVVNDFSTMNGLRGHLCNFFDDFRIEFEMHSSRMLEGYPTLSAVRK